MKKLISILSLTIIGGIIFASLIAANPPREIVNYCVKEESKEKCRSELVPFRYSGMKVTDITYRGFNQVKEVTIPLFYDSKYRFVFNTDGLPYDIEVKVFDSHSTERKDKDEPLASFNSSTKSFIWEPDEKHQDIPYIYVSYLIPAVPPAENHNIEKGCVVLMSGFENELTFTGEGLGGEEDSQ